MGFLPLRLERTYEQWWFVAPIDWAAANGHTEVVKELLKMDPSLLHNLTSKRRMRRLEKLWDDPSSFSQAALGRAKVVKELLLFNQYHGCSEEQGILKRIDGSKESTDDGSKPGISMDNKFDMGVVLNHGLNSNLSGAYWVLYVAACAGDESLLHYTIKSLTVSDQEAILQGLDGEFGLSDLLYAAARGRNETIFQTIIGLAGDTMREPGFLYVNDASVIRHAIDNDVGNAVLLTAHEQGMTESHVEYIHDNSSMSYNHRTDYNNVQAKALLAAARAGNVDMVKALLLRDYDDDHITNKKKKTNSVLCFRDSNGCTALHAAAGRGHLQVVKLILELCPASINGKDSKENTALHTAARRGCLQVAMEMISHNKEVIYMRNKHGETPLHSAVIGTKQAPPNLVMKQGGKIEMVKELLKGASSMPDYVNWKTNQGQTALHLSVASAKIDEKLVAVLLEAPGISVNERNEQGCTPLDLAKMCRESHPVAEFRCNIAISLLHLAMPRAPVVENPHNIHNFTANSEVDLIKSESVGSTTDALRRYCEGHEVKTRPTSSRSLASFLSIPSPEVHLNILGSPDIRTKSNIIRSALIPTQCFTLFQTLLPRPSKFCKKGSNVNDGFSSDSPRPEDRTLRQHFMTTSTECRQETPILASAISTRIESPSCATKSSLLKIFFHQTDGGRKHKAKHDIMGPSSNHNRSHSLQNQSLYNLAVNDDGVDDTMIDINHDGIRLDHQFSASRQSVHMSNQCFCLHFFNGRSQREAKSVVNPTLEEVESSMRINSIGTRSVDNPVENMLENIPQLTQSSSHTESSNGAMTHSSEPEPTINARSTSGSSHNSTPRPSASLSLSPWLSPRLRAARKLQRNITVSELATGNASPSTGSTNGNGPPPRLSSFLTSPNQTESACGTNLCLASSCFRREREQE